MTKLSHKQEKRYIGKCIGGEINGTWLSRADKAFVGFGGAKYEFHVQVGDALRELKSDPRILRILPELNRDDEIGEWRLANGLE